MNKLLTILFLTCTYVGFTQEATISGTIHHAESSWIFLEKKVKVEDRMDFLHLDSCKLSPDGSFRLKVQVKEATSMFIFDGSDALELVLTPGDQLVIDTDKRFFDETISIKGTGSERNLAIHQLEVIKEGINTKLLDAAFNPDTLQIFAQYDQSFVEYSEIVGAYRIRYPELQDYLIKEIDQLQEEQNMYKTYIRGDHTLNMRIAGLTGSQAPELTGMNLKGETVKLSDFKGKITVLDFWANWCLPCRAEFPELERFQELYGKDVNFVSIGVFCTENEWKEIAKDLHVANQFFISKSMQAQLEPYGIAYIPRYIVLDENHKVLSALAPLPSSSILQKYWVK